MTKIITIVLLAITCNLIAQETCHCPATQDSSGEITDTLFQLKSGKSLLLCGGMNVDTRIVTFSGFSIYACGRDSAIGFWSENKTCRISVSRDTLNIESLVNLPVGAEFGYKPVALLVDKLYPAGDRIRRATRISQGVRKFTPAVCNAIVKKYDETPKPILDDLEDVMSRLFMAAISGNTRAYGLFTDFTKVNPELDADSQEQYNELSDALRYFKR